MDLLTKIGRTLTQEDYKKLFEEGLFVFDTNVLLDLYRLPHEAKEDLLLILESKELKNRVWLPFQAQLEYIYNKNGVIREQNTKFDVVSDKVDGFQNEIHKLAASIKDEIDELNLKKRHSSIEAEKYINDELFKASIDKLNEFKEELSDLKREQPDIADRDLIGDRIATIFKNKVGKGFDKAELQDIYKKGNDRYKNKIPPGYKDDKKEGSHFYEDKEYIRKYGDLILWKEIIQKAEKDKTEYIVLVSSDLKDDWRGKHNTVRYELLNEIYYTATKLKIFHIYDSSNFMKYAKEHLKLEVSEESIQEAKDIHDKKVLVDLVDFIEQYAKTSKTRVTIGGLKDYNPTISKDKADQLSILLNDIMVFEKNTFEFQEPILISVYRSLVNNNNINIRIRVKSQSEVSLTAYYDYATSYYRSRFPELGRFNITKILNMDQSINTVSLRLTITP